MNLFNLFKKKKKTILFRDFYNAVGEMAKKYGEDYWVVKISMSGHDNGRVLFSGYINNFDWHNDKASIREVLDGLASERRSAKESQMTETEVIIEN